MAVSYPIVAVIPMDSVIGRRVLVRYARTVIPSAERHGWRGRARSVLGLPPDQIRLPISLALTCGSYHLRVTGPPDTYIANRRFECRHCQEFVGHNWTIAEPGTGEKPSCGHSSSEVPTVEAHYRVRRRRGQNFVHLYMRGYGQPPKQMAGLRLRTQFKELPPGTRGQAVVVAMLATLFIGIAGYVQSTHRDTNNSDLPALLLALPVLAASWLTVSADPNRIVGLSLTARLSLLISCLLSVASVLFYFVHNAGSMPGRLSLLGIRDPWWVTICVFSAANFLYILHRFALKFTSYTKITQRPDQASAEYART
jgi:hypothetical protein